MPTARKTTQKKKTAPSPGRKKARGSKKSAVGKKSTRKYSPNVSERVGEELHEMELGELRSGSGQKVTSRKQAIAIALSEARRAGEKVPPAPSRRKRPRR